MYCSLIVSHESAQKLIPGNGLEAHFAEVYIFFSLLVSYRWLKQGYGTCCHISFITHMYCSSRQQMDNRLFKLQM